MAENGGYSQSQILTMQQDAVRRVNEMQRRARAVAGTGAELAPPAAKPSQIVHPPTASHTAQTQKPPQSVPTSGSQGNTSMRSKEAIDVRPNNASPLQALLSGSLGSSGGGIFEGFLDKLGIDNERLIIIGILLLLLNEGADNILILALVYILL